MEYLYAYAQEDSFEDLKRRGQIADCPHCTKTATKLNRTSDQFHCYSCDHSFYKAGSATDVIKIEL